MMDRWAANALRALGIFIVGGLTICASLLLLLDAKCAAQGSFEPANSPEVGQALVAMGIVWAVGVGLLAWLARGMLVRGEGPAVQPLSHEALPGVPIVAQPVEPARQPHSQSRGAVNRLLYVIAVQVLLTAAITFFDSRQLWPRSRPNPPKSWAIYLDIWLVAREAPYVCLLVALFAKLKPRTFAYALAVPGVSLLFNMPFLNLDFGHPMGFEEKFLAWAAHIVILAFAVRALRQARMQLEGWDLVVACSATFFYFLIAYGGVPYFAR